MPDKTHLPRRDAISPVLDKNLNLARQDLPHFPDIVIGVLLIHHGGEEDKPGKARSKALLDESHV